MRVHFLWCKVYQRTHTGNLRECMRTTVVYTNTSRIYTSNQSPAVKRKTWLLDNSEVSRALKGKWGRQTENSDLDQRHGSAKRITGEGHLEEGVSTGGRVGVDIAGKVFTRGTLFGEGKGWR